MRTVFLSFLYRLSTSHAKKIIPTLQWQRYGRRMNVFSFLFLPLDSPDYTEEYIFFPHISTCLHFHFHFFYRPPREILANQNSIDSQRLCLASPTINVKFRETKTGTDVALTGSGFRWKREYLHAYSNCRFRREGLEIIKDFNEKNIYGMDAFED